MYGNRAFFRRAENYRKKGGVPRFLKKGVANKGGVRLKRGGYYPFWNCVGGIKVARPHPQAFFDQIPIAGPKLLQKGGCGAEN